MGGKNKHGQYQVRVRCVCGAESLHVSSRLRTGKTKRCLYCARPLQTAIRHDSFSKQSRESDFWAGVLAADGNILGRQVRLSFKSSDLSFLRDWRRWVGSKHKIYTAAKIMNGCCFKQGCITITSEKIVRDLKIHYNITERKSLTLRPSKRLSAEFLAGLWAGDGTIGQYNNGGRSPTLQWSIGFCGTKAMMNAVQQFFSDFSKSKVQQIKPNLCSVSYRGNRICKILAQILIANSLFVLPRKIQLLSKCLN